MAPGGGVEWEGIASSLALLAMTWGVEGEDSTIPGTPDQSGLLQIRYYAKVKINST
jgi:hypothetical protein